MISSPKQRIDRLIELQVGANLQQRPLNECTGVNHDYRPHQEIDLSQLSTSQINLARHLSEIVLNLSLIPFIVMEAL